MFSLENLFIMRSKCNFIVIIILIFSSVGSCANYKHELNNDKCSNYVRFLDENWKFDSGNSIYEFVGAPEYWHSDKYVIEGCLIGLSKDQIVNIFGNPSKEFIFYNYQYITYCLEESCLLEYKSVGRQVAFYLDSVNIVRAVIVNPALQKLE